jgi:Uma2 family endonuclease
MSSAARVLPSRYREASYDPFEDDMGENSLQRFISELLRPLIEAHMQAHGPSFVGADQYVGWDPDDGEKVLAPDMDVLSGVAPGEDFEFWKVWQTGIAPSFALEIVSKRKKKDDTLVPPLYAELGVEELVIFDPRFQRRREGLRFQV